MTLLSKDQILAADDKPFRDVETPEWGGTVRVRTMTASERDAYEALVYGGGGGKPDLSDFRARFVSMVLVDEQGARLFTAEDVAALGAKSIKAMDRVFKVGQELNVLTDKDVKELVKNSEAGPDAGSSSSSPGA